MTQSKACCNANLCTGSPTCTDLGANPGLRGETPLTNILSCGTTLVLLQFNITFGFVRFKFRTDRAMLRILFVATETLLRACKWVEHAEK
jgi:hypothetical protein